MNEVLIKEIRKNITQRKLDAVIVTDLYKILNLLGIESSLNIIEIGFYLIVTGKEVFLIGDPFSFLEVPKGVKVKRVDINRIREDGFSTLVELRELLTKLKIKKIGSFDNIRLAKYRIIRIPDPFTGFFLKPDERRISIIKENALICKKVLEASLRELKNEVREIAIRNIIDEEIYRAGGERRAFPTKVIFGDNTSNPFALSNYGKLREGDPVFINFGIIRLGVGVEIARTYIWRRKDKYLGKTYNDITEIYRKFLSFISYGKIAKEIYKYVLELLKGKGYEKNFIPPINAPLTLSGKAINISKDSNFIIKEGTILYPQLNLYFPGKYGIKFQDIFYLSGKESNLTNFLNSGDVDVLSVSDKV